MRSTISRFHLFYIAVRVNISTCHPLRWTPARDSTAMLWARETVMITPDLKPTSTVLYNC
jgi:hypothetical protein